MYSDKIIKKEINDTIIRAVKLNPVTAASLQFKCAKVLAPSIGGVYDAYQSQDRSLAASTVMNLLCSRCSDQLFDELQQKLLGSLLGADDEPLTTIENINTYLLSSGLNQFDLMVFLFKCQLLDGLIESSTLKGVIPKVKDLADKFLNTEQGDPDGTEQA